MPQAARRSSTAMTGSSSGCTTSGTRSSRCALASGLTLPEASALARHANPRITAMAYAGLDDDGRAKLGEKLAMAFQR